MTTAKQLLAIAALSIAMLAPASAQALEVGEIFSFKSPIQVWSCGSLEDLRGLVANEPRYHPGSKTKTPANCGTPASQQNYRVIRKSGDAVCIWLPEGGNGECTWVIAPSDQIVATRTAPKNFWPEGTGISEKCAREMVQYEDPRTGKLPADLKEKLTSECWANLERWSVQLKKNLSDPAFKKQLLDVMR